MSVNLKGYVPLHTAIEKGQRKALETLMSFHNNRKLPWQTLLVAKTNETPLHVAVRALRVNDLQWMVEYGGFAPGLVMKSIENRDPVKLLKEAKKHLGKMGKYRKKALKAAKTGREPPEVPKAILPPPPSDPPLDPAVPQREHMARQLPGKTQAYLLDEPTYVTFHTTPLPPPEPAAKKGKKGKGGGKKAKKEKVIPQLPFAMGFDEALLRLDGKGGPKITEVLANLAKKYEEEKKAAEKVAAEKAKAKAQAEKDAKAKEAKGKKK